MRAERATEFRDRYPLGLATCQGTLTRCRRARKLASANSSKEPRSPGPAAKRLVRANRLQGPRQSRQRAPWREKERGPKEAWGLCFPALGNDLGIEPEAWLPQVIGRRIDKRRRSFTGNLPSGFRNHCRDEAAS